MEQTRALAKLLEAAELIGMMEELSAPGREQLGPLTRIGLRITLKNVRESILSSHDTLAAEIVAAGAARVELSSAGMASPPHAPASHNPGGGGAAASPQAAPPPVTARRDLRAAIERFVDPAER